VLIPIASAGPYTGFLEVVATSIGAGIVVGGFAVGIVGFATGESQRPSEAMAMAGANLGGFFGLLLLLIDTLTKHVV
jgi:hypothetical protein